MVNEKVVRNKCKIANKRGYDGWPGCTTDIDDIFDVDDVIDDVVDDVDDDVVDVVDVVDDVVDDVDNRYILDYLRNGRLLLPANFQVR